MGRFLEIGQIGRLIRLLGGWDRRSPAEFPALSRAFFGWWETLFSHDPAPPHASRRTGMSEASSRIAMTMLKARTAIGEVSTGRSALPNSVQIEVETMPMARLSAVWIAIFQGKVAIAA